jgi:hypothetical protein
MRGGAVTGVREPSQLDRIEAKLDQMLEFRDAALKMMMPKIPAAARPAALKLLAKREQI